ncbi:hypothetical protein ACFLW2_00060 [Chloroflexota bacterium]
MTEIRHQVPGGSEEIESAEIYIPDDSDAGTGEFTFTIMPNALPASKVFWSTIVHPPKILVTATFDTSMNVSVKLGLTESLDQKNFRIPISVVPQEKHALRIHFSRWKLTDAFLDNEPIVSVT